MCSRWNINKNINVILFEWFETDDKVFIKQIHGSIILINCFLLNEHATVNPARSPGTRFLSIQRERPPSEHDWKPWSCRNREISHSSSTSSDVAPASWTYVSFSSIRGNTTVLALIMKRKKNSIGKFSVDMCPQLYTVLCNNSIPSNKNLCIYIFIVSLVSLYVYVFLRSISKNKKDIHHLLFIPEPLFLPNP